MKLDRRKAVVTGGSRGIGQGIARGLAEAGADIAIIYQSRLDRAETFAAEIKALGRADPLLVKADVSKRADVERAADTIIQACGQVDILVNNAGISIVGNAETYAEDDWDRVMDINLKGTFLCSQAFGRQMIKQKRGSIINISSISAQIVNWPNRHAVYNASKAGVSMLTKCLAVEWAEHNVRVNALAPGLHRTDMAEQVMRDDPETAQKFMVDGAIQRRIADPSELAGAAVYLASDASTFTTGEIITVDGGFVLR